VRTHLRYVAPVAPEMPARVARAHCNEAPGTGSTHMFSQAMDLDAGSSDLRNSAMDLEAHTTDRRKARLLKSPSEIQG